MSVKNPLLHLDRVDSAPIANSDFDPQFLQWIWVLVDSLNENLGDIESILNLLMATNLALLKETVTLTTGLPTFTVVNGALYSVGENVVGSGIQANSTILSITGNIITLTKNVTSTGPSALTFIPIQQAIGNGMIIYDTTNNVYVGMQNGVLVKFTTTTYP